MPVVTRSMAVRLAEGTASGSNAPDVNQIHQPQTINHSKATSKRAKQDTEESRLPELTKHGLPDEDSSQLPLIIKKRGKLRTDQKNRIGNSVIDETKDIEAVDDFVVQRNARKLSTNEEEISEDKLMAQKDFTDPENIAPDLYKANILGKTRMFDHLKDESSLSMMVMPVNLQELTQTELSMLVPRNTVEPEPEVAGPSNATTMTSFKTPYMETPVRPRSKHSTPRKLAFNLDDSTGSLFETSKDVSQSLTHPLNTPDYEVTPYDQVKLLNGDPALTTAYREQKPVPEWASDDELAPGSLMKIVPFQNHTGTLGATIFPSERHEKLFDCQEPSISSDNDSSHSNSPSLQASQGPSEVSFSAV